ncbi:hypothetical protein [Corynebacterium macginleyi]|uniref:hypothetical protein n=1 Tax=Corynebacterium macginleyi TaxID=38290 RepID=UPI000EF9994C|nr:hypothetical protein [Corynebacterium macginleyi]MBK4137264.1 hypothetical protein [Corynebacterium macginleyi]MBK4148799.1 hypothetical protein [Corynebacterium macginleyi]QRP20484.1 hypothetical protein I6J25_07010 [Corynebacterium macginleyi]RMB64834.1 hypothetical protein D9V82_09965 [Corynebacterium macginleyi]RMB65025.1 hypothetical protein D9542_10975 [Corynebacterium macginleyi]
MSEESFLLKYDGARLQSGPMSVAEIGPVFLALDELVKAIYRNVDPLSAEVPELQIVGVEQGSYSVFFDVGSQALDGVLNWASDPKANTALTLAGGVVTVKEIIGWAMKAMSNKVAMQEQTEVPYPDLLENLQLERLTDALLAKSRGRKNVAAIVKPVLELGIETVELASSRSVEVHINEEEARRMVNYAETLSEPTVQVATVSARFATANLIEPLKRKWRIETEEFGTISIRLLDEEFAALVSLGEANLAQTYDMRIRVETQVGPDDEEKSSYELLTVYTGDGETGEQMELEL